MTVLVHTARTPEMRCSMSLPPSPAPEPALAESRGSAAGRQPFTVGQSIVFSMTLLFVWLMRNTCGTDPWLALRYAGCAAVMVLTSAAAPRMAHKIVCMIKAAE